MDPIARGLVRGLILRPKDQSLHEAILARGPAAIPPLCELLMDEALDAEDAPGEGFATIRAAELLGRLRAEAAIPMLLGAMARSSWDSILRDTALAALIEIGPASIDLILDAWDLLEGPPAARPLLTDLADYLASALASVGRGDERVFERLVAHVRANPSQAGKLARLGDPRALPLLHELASTYDPRRAPARDHHMIWFELYGAIESLGEPTAAEKARHREMIALRTRRLRRPDRSRRER